MTDTTFTPEELEQPVETAKKKPNSTLRLIRYTAGKFISLFLAVLIGMYLVILIANMGGYVDQIMKAQIRDGIGLSVSMDPELRRRPAAERQQLINELVAVEESVWVWISPLLDVVFAFCSTP
jgi:peptide/nickel transport system permease protein